MGNANRNIKADLAVLSGTFESLSIAADYLLTELQSLDGTVTGMLSQWTGGPGESYGRAWMLWHRGADEVELALAAMAKLLGEAASVYQAQEQAAATTLRGVHDD